MKLDSGLTNQLIGNGGQAAGGLNIRLSEPDMTPFV